MAKKKQNAKKATPAKRSRILTKEDVLGMLPTEDQLSLFPDEVQVEHSRVMNDLDGALFGDAFSAPFGLLPNAPAGLGTMLSQVNTLFKSMRWYFLSNFRQLLSEMYIEHALVQAVVDIPVDDAFRGGIELESKQLSADQIKEVLTCIDENDDLQALAQTEKWNRLFGGGGVVIITGQDPKMPLDMDQIREGSPLEFKDADMWELFSDRQNTEVYDPIIHRELEHYRYYSQDVHRTRVMRMKGLRAPSFLRPRLRGWGFSICEALVRSINQYLKSNDLTFEVLDEFKLDIFKIKGLTSSLLSPAGEQKIRRRVQIANKQKNFQNAITLDSLDDYVQKQLSFSGLAEVMEGLRFQIAADLRIPQTKLWGQSAPGFSSGEDSLENYNSMVEGQVRRKVKFHALNIVKLRCQWLFGMVPDDLELKWKPLRELSSEQEETVKEKRFNRVLQAKSAGEITVREFRDACNKDNLLPIKLDTSVGDLLQEQQDDQREAALENPEPDPGKPGQNKE